MPQRTLQKDRDILDLARDLGELDFPINVSWTTGFNRSLASNRLMWMWANEVAKQRGDCSPDEVQNEWKRAFGVPIACEDVEFATFWRYHFPDTCYAKQLLAMQYIPVTSNFKTGEMTRFLEQVQRDCLEQGFQITDPEALGL